MQLADFVFQPFIPVGALAAEGFVPVETVPCNAARGFGVAGNHVGNEGLEHCRAVPHAAVVAVGAAGFGMKHVEQGFDFGQEGEPRVVVIA